MDTKFSVALHILMFLATSEKVATSQVLADSVDTNGSFIRKLMASLKGADLVKSRQGKSGFVLGREASQIDLSQVYQALYGDKSVLHAHEHPNQDCPLGKRVEGIIQPVFNQVEEQFRQSLKGITLQMLVDDLYKGEEK